MIQKSQSESCRAALADTGTVQNYFRIMNQTMHYSIPHTSDSMLRWMGSLNKILYRYIAEAGEPDTVIRRNFEVLGYGE
ncbi:MAG: hypothetical protein WGN25_13245 [Candidatus Electrothrix sp. GW3-4]|uniref:hypothetical protein n=1 Tax=Candidatus Electrothrix sp. GW3-4 TaxID=3126740 RepID=UPI0030CD5937